MVSDRRNPRSSGGGMPCIRYNARERMINDLRNSQMTRGAEASKCENRKFNLTGRLRCLKERSEK